MRKFLVTYVQAYANLTGVYISKPTTVYLLAGDADQVPYIESTEPLSSVVDKLATHGFRRGHSDSSGKRPWVMPAAILSVEESW